MNTGLKLPGVVVALLAAYASGATINGRVVEDQSGSGIASADVRIRKVGDRFLAANPDTDAEGRFEGVNLAEGDYTIDVAKTNHIGASIHLHLGSGASSTIIRLVRGAVISGQARDSTGRAIRATIYAFSAGGGPMTRASLAAGRSAGLDPQGQYKISNLPPGEYQMALSYAAAGGGPLTVGETPANSGVLFYPTNAHPQTLTLSGGEERHNVDFAVSVAEFYTVGGKVQLPDSKNRPYVSLVNVDQPAIVSAAIWAQPDGTFILKGVPPGTYTLLATSSPGVGPGILDGNAGPDAVFSRMRVNVAGQNIEGLALVPQKGASVDLTLRSGGACPASAQVTLNAVDDWGVSLMRQITLTAGEKKTLPGLAPIRFAASVSGLAEDCFALPGDLIDLSGEVVQPAVVSLASAGSIRGKLDGSGPAAIVLLAPDGPMQVVFPDAQSRFDFTGLRPGKYRIAAQPAGAAQQSRWVPDVSQMFEVQVPGGSTIELDLAMPAPKKDP